MWPFTSETQDVKEPFEDPRERDHGAAIFDAVDYGVGLLSQQPAKTRRILLLLSQPQDFGSKTRGEEVARRLGENNVTIFSVTFSPEKAWLKDEFTKPRHENPPYQMSPNLPAVLHTFNLSTPLGVALNAMREDGAAGVARLSGGEHVRFGDRRGLEQQMAILANHIPNRYALSFRPSKTTPGFHSLQVQVVGWTDQIDVEARAGYWAESSKLNEGR